MVHRIHIRILLAESDTPSLTFHEREMVSLALGVNKNSHIFNKRNRQLITHEKDL